MLIDNVDLVPGSEITNMTIATGASLPGTPNEGELFYLTSGNIGMHVYDSSQSNWIRVTTDTSVNAASSSGITGIQLTNTISFSGTTLVPLTDFTTTITTVGTYRLTGQIYYYNPGSTSAGMRFALNGGTVSFTSFGFAYFYSGGLSQYPFQNSGGGSAVVAHNENTADAAFFRLDVMIMFANTGTFSFKAAQYSPSGTTYIDPRSSYTLTQIY